jgi:transcriptional regulator with XRE-family HTH domain
MDNLGTIIYSLRIKNKMSAQELAEGICSNKYIYMIENNERVPSVEILNKLFEKLKYDYTEYLQFAEMEDSIMVARLVREIDYLRNFDKGEQLKGKIKELEDKNDGTLDQYILYNKAFYELLSHNNMAEAIRYCNDSLLLEGYK